MSGSGGGGGPPRSLFGGPLSTRHECTNKEALRRAHAQEEARLAQARSKKASSSSKIQQGHAPGCRPPATKNAPTYKKPPTSTLPPEPPEIKKKRLYQEALDDFDDLLTDGPSKPKPKPRPQPSPKEQTKLSKPQSSQKQQGSLPLSASKKSSSPALKANGSAATKPGTVKNYRRKPEDKFDEDKLDRLAMEKARNSLSRDHAFASREQKRRKDYSESEEDSEGFVVDDEEEEEPEWRREMRELTGYDPRKYQNERFDDRSMEAGYNDILAEEKRSARVARAEDKREEEEERKRLEAKAKAKKKQKT